MKIKHSHILVGSVAFLLAACGGSGETPEKAASAGSGDMGNAAKEAAALTPQYLAGTWCFVYTDLGKGNREEQGVRYDFKADGSLTYQRSAASETMDPGSYEIADGMVDLRPTFMVFDLRIDSVQESEFVLKGMGRHHFVRGVCPE